jgi:hypothetical protein
MINMNQMVSKYTLVHVLYNLTGYSYRSLPDGQWYIEGDIESRSSLGDNMLSRVDCWLKPRPCVSKPKHLKATLTLGERCEFDGSCFRFIPSCSLRSSSCTLRVCRYTSQVYSNTRFCEPYNFCIASSNVNRWDEYVFSLDIPVYGL